MANNAVSVTKDVLNEIEALRTELEQVKAERVADAIEIGGLKAENKHIKAENKRLREALNLLLKSRKYPYPHISDADWRKAESLTAGKGEPTNNDQLPVYTPNGFV